MQGFNALEPADWTCLPIDQGQERIIPARSRTLVFRLERDKIEIQLILHPIVISVTPNTLNPQPGIPPLPPERVSRTQRHQKTEFWLRKLEVTNNLRPCQVSRGDEGRQGLRLCRIAQGQPP